MKCGGTYIMGLSISWGCPYTNVVTKKFPFQEYITIASIYIKRNAFFSLRNLENRKHLNITKNESTSLKIQLERQIRKYLQDRQRVKGLRAWGKLYHPQCPRREDPPPRSKDWDGKINWNSQCIAPSHRLITDLKMVRKAPSHQLNDLKMPLSHFVSAGNRQCTDIKVQKRVMRHLAGKQANYSTIQHITKGEDPTNFPELTTKH